MTHPRLALNILAVAAVALATTAVQARDYSFSQGSWSDASSVTGSFSGDDNDNDGYLELGELTTIVWEYQAASSSRVRVNSALLLPVFRGFAFKVGNGADLILGNDANEGLEIDDGFTYVSGAGPYLSGQALITFVDPAFALLGYIDNASTADIMVTDLTSTPAVPEPSVAWLLAAGLGALGLRARRRS